MALKAPLSGLLIYSEQIAQIAYLPIEKIIIIDDYFNFPEVFLKQKVLVLPEQIKLNKHAIKPENNKWPLYEPIYNLREIELKTLRAYIKTYLKTGFI